MDRSAVDTDRRELARLFPPDVVVRAGDPDRAAPEALFPDEAAQIARAVDKRKREYAEARRLAREAMERLGRPRQAVVNDAERVPVFPAGLVGSISHTRGLCVVALASAERYRAVGVDVEGSAPLDEKLFETVLRGEERAALEGLEPHARGLHAKLVFCIKECAYKAQYPEARRYFGFSGMTVEASSGRFVATLRLDAAPYFEGHRFEGRYLVSGPFVMAGLAVER